MNHDNRMQACADIDLNAIDRVHQRALALGALQPIDTDSCLIEDHGLPFIIKWISPEAAKPRMAKPGPRSAGNPFAHPEPDLTLGAVPPHHVALLNKYPVMARHLLVVTREFEPQLHALNAADFEALAGIMASNGGLGFYNGGEIAGASQEHKHLQWIPQLPPLAERLPALRQARAEQFDFVNAFVALDDGLWSDPSRGARLAGHYSDLLAAANMAAPGLERAPYNLLLTRAWMWLIPRRAESWEGMSINALGFAGSLFVKTRDRFEPLRAAGPLRALRGVSLPRGG